MNYSLGNMLSRGGALNPYGLSLDLAFAADKTLAARKGPTPTFTRASTATFVGSNGLIQSAAINAPRFNHDPVTLACKGLLIEESRTNALQHSANFKNTTSSNYWDNLSATTVTIDQIASPDGGVNADLLTTSTASFDCFARRTGIFAGSTQYAYSIFLKQGPSGHRYVGLYIGAGISALKFPFFDFNNPTTVQIPSGTMVGTINSTRVDAYPNGWYRVSIVFTTAATPVTTLCGVYISQSDGTIPASSAAGLNAYIWGIQVELGSFPTSYIPTTTTALTRSADVCSITGSDFTSFYNQNEGTIVVVGDKTMSQNTTGSYLTFQAGATEVGPLITRTTTSLLGRIRNNTAQDLTNLDLSESPSGIKRIAVAWRATSDNNDRDYASGGLILPKTNPIAGTAANNQTNLLIGSRPSSAIFNGHISSLQYYRKRLTNAKLQSLTA